MNRTIRNAALALTALAVLAGCDEQNPFRNTTPGVSTGTGLVWELALDGFPSGWAFPVGDRFFVGTSPTPSNGSWVLDARDDGTLVFRSFADLTPGQSVVRTGVVDLTETRGTGSFDGVATAPGSGYEETAEVVVGHVYAFRLTTLSATVIPINYAKLEVIEVAREFDDDPDSRYVAFRWAYQRQPLNRNLQVDESP